MRVQICAVGRLRRGPEFDLISDYLKRFDQTGRLLGLGPITITEIDDRKGAGMATEAPLIAAAIPKGAITCALDERGKQVTSPEFAKMLAGWRDQGRSCVSFLIGGADGLQKDLRESADQRLSFGPMVWPHMLVRVMLAEQLFRAASILANKPYHRN